MSKKLHHALLRLLGLDGSQAGDDGHDGGAEPKVSDAFVQTSARLLSRLPLIGADYPLYRRVVEIDFDSARTLETWFFNDPESAERELQRRLDLGSGEGGGPRETKARWLEVRSSLDSVIVRGWQGRGSPTQTARWNPVLRLELAVDRAMTGDTAELEHLAEAYATTSLSHVFWDGLAIQVARRLLTKGALHPSLVTFLPKGDPSSRSISVVSRWAQTGRVDEAGSVLLAAFPAGLQGGLRGNSSRVAEPVSALRAVTPPSEALRASYRRYRIAQLSPGRFWRTDRTLSLRTPSGSRGSIVQPPAGPNDRRE